MHHYAHNDITSLTLLHIEALVKIFMVFDDICMLYDVVF